MTNDGVIDEGPIQDGVQNTTDASGVNSGVLLGTRPEDWIAGGSPIPYEERLPSGDWTPYLPTPERQSSRNVDSMACVSYSALNCIESQILFLTRREENYSDRALAKMSNTQANGNYLWRVADTIRQEGLLLEEQWPVPPDFDWDTYYAQIPIELENTAGEFLKKYDVKYEWLPDTSKATLQKALKQSPIQVVIPGHAIMCFYSIAQLDKYFDHYEPFIKEYTQPFQAAMKYVLTIKSEHMTEAEVMALQAIEGYSDPDGVAYWKGKPLSQYLKARLPDKEAELKKALDALNG